jgi:ABC-type xylose transport system substrate-binding protein
VGKSPAYICLQKLNSFLEALTMSQQPAQNEKQAAEFLGVSVHWMRRARWAGNGPEFMKYGSAVRYDPETLLAYRNSRIRKSTSDVTARVL